MLKVTHKHTHYRINGNNKVRCALPLIGLNILILLLFLSCYLSRIFPDEHSLNKTWAFKILYFQGTRHWPSPWLPSAQEKSSVQFSSVDQSCPTLCDPMNRSTPGLPVHHQLPEITQTHIHRVSDAIQPSHPLLSPSPPAPSPSQHQSLFQWVNSLHEVAKVLEFQL